MTDDKTAQPSDEAPPVPEGRVDSLPIGETVEAGGLSGISKETFGERSKGIFKGLRKN